MNEVRRFLYMGGALSWCLACAETHPARLMNGNEERDAAALSDTTRDLSRSSSDAGADAQTSPLDAGADAQTSPLDAGANGDADRSHVPGDTETNDTDVSDAGGSVIFPQPVLVLRAQEICEQLPSLEAAIVEVDLTGLVERGEAQSWEVTSPSDAGVELNDAALGGDAVANDAMLGNDTSYAREDSLWADASRCTAQLIPYVVPCGASVLIVTSREETYGDVLHLPNTQALALGCLVSGCQEQCVPAAPSAIQRVRVRVTRALGGLTPENKTVRLHGLDFPALASLELLQTL